MIDSGPKDIDGVSLDKVLAWGRQNQRQIPHNVFLNIATQVCNGLEALHGHVVRLAERHRVAAPTVFAVYAALRPFRDGAPAAPSS